MSVRVDPPTLRAKAAQITEGWPDPPKNETPTAPCDYQLAHIAIFRLWSDDIDLCACLHAGKTEAQRLSEAFNNVADTYQKVNDRTAAALNLGEAAPTEPLIPAPPSTPRAPTSSPTKTTPSITADQLTLDQSAQMIESPNQTGSLEAYASTWTTYASTLEAHANSFQIDDVDWEGDAADAAYEKLSQHKQWMLKIAEACRKQADHAKQFAAAHTEAAPSHHHSAQEVTDLENAIKDAMDKGDNDQLEELLKRWESWTSDSDQIRQTYAGKVGSIERADPQMPPDAAPGAASVRTNAGTAPSDPQPGAAPGGSGAPGGAGAPSGAGAPQAQQAGMQQPAAQAGGTPGGGQQGGGSGGGKPGGGSGGGMPGGMPSGMPAAAKHTPTLPHGPSLKPAHAGGGGGAHGGGGGGGASPLQPAVGAKAVAPSAGAAPGGAVGAEGPPHGGGMGGGMGGMPMGGRGGGEAGGKAKSQLGPKEALYTEDREWTEGVIGSTGGRKRKDTPDTKDSK